MSRNDLPVIFIAGKGRSGSTVLSMVLGELDGAVSGGELRFTWQRGVIENRNCGCGEPFADCPLWSAVMTGVRADPEDPVDVGSVVAAHDRLFRWPAMPRFVLSKGPSSALTTRGRWGRALETWAHATGRLYRALVAETGAGVVIDSSKWPTDPAMLGLVPGIRPIAVHLVRDPRAVAWSWQRKRTQHDMSETREMDRFGPLNSSASWLARNAVVEAATRRHGTARLLMRYEDFVADPAAAVGRIAAVAEVDLDPTGVIDGQSVQRTTNHTVAGNPARFGAGPMLLRPDDEWRQAMPASRRRVITAVTLPLLRRYGYRPTS